MRTFFTCSRLPKKLYCNIIDGQWAILVFKGWTNIPSNLTKARKVNGSKSDLEMLPLISSLACSLGLP